MTPNTKLTPFPPAGFSFSLRSPSWERTQSSGPARARIYSFERQAWRGFGRHGGECGLARGDLAAIAALISIGKQAVQNRFLPQAHEFPGA
jgi:hypothetical protein